MDFKKITVFGFGFLIVSIVYFRICVYAYRNSQGFKKKSHFEIQEFDSTGDHVSQFHRGSK